MNSAAEIRTLLLTDCSTTIYLLTIICVNLNIILTCTTVGLSISDNELTVTNVNLENKVTCLVQF